MTAPIPPELVPVAAALRELIIADNVNFVPPAMRYAGLFEAARIALRDATGESLWPTSIQGRDPIAERKGLAELERAIARFNERHGGAA